MTRALVQQLRNALEEWQDADKLQRWHAWDEEDDAALAAADEYLAQPEQEPLYAYEWDTQTGSKRRDFSSARWNGVDPDRTLTLYIAPSITPGMVPVPVLPTEEMLTAGGEGGSYCVCCGYDNGGGNPGYVYAAMLAARPGEKT